jgi:threonine/homoserine/homoserine lactone efflux protein
MKPDPKTDQHHPAELSASSMTIIWNLMLLGIGILWMIGCHESNHTATSIVSVRTIDVMFSLLILSLAAWIICYSCQDNKPAALGFDVIIVALSLGLSLIMFQVSQPAGLLMCLFVAWMIYLLILSMHELSHEPTKQNLKSQSKSQSKSKSK